VVTLLLDVSGMTFLYDGAKQGTSGGALPQFTKATVAVGADLVGPTPQTTAKISNVIVSY
jgi:hypothetical protein